MLTLLPIDRIGGSNVHPNYTLPFRANHLRQTIALSEVQHSKQHLDMGVCYKTLLVPCELRRQRGAMILIAGGHIPST